MRESKLDIGRAKSLVEEISANLAALPKESAKYAQLRAEVEDLKAMRLCLAVPMLISR